MAEGLERFFDRHNGEEKPQYLSWGVPVLDERIFAEPGDMVVLGGYPSDGKTALALQFRLRHRQKSPGRVLQLRVHPGTSCLTGQ